MSGYLASARIVNAPPRIARARRSSAPDEDRPDSVSDAIVVEVDAMAVEAASPASAHRMGLAERWGAARERWSQLTFYLFDPDSWR